MSHTSLTLSLIKELIAICRLEKDKQIPERATVGSLFSITKTAEELSIVCFEKYVPQSVTAERGRLGFKVEGPLDFSLTGVLASLANPLAEANISIFVISTFDTDYILVKRENFEKTQAILGNFCNIIDSNE